MEADRSRWWSPVWQAAIAPTAAPSQLRLILPCQDRLADLPLTAHEWGSGRNWTHQTPAALYVQTSRVILLAVAHNILSFKHMCFVFGKSHFQDKHFGFGLVMGDGWGHVLFADTPITHKRCVTAQRCSGIPGGHWVLITCRKCGLALHTCRFHVFLGESSPTSKMLLSSTVYPHEGKKWPHGVACTSHSHTQWTSHFYYVQIISFYLKIHSFLLDMQASIFCCHWWNGAYCSSTLF